MDHDDHIWIAIRVIGLYLLLQAALAALQMLLHINSAVRFSFAGTDASDLEAKAWLGAGGSLLELLVCTLLGRYLFLDGARVFAWAHRRQEAFRSKRAAQQGVAADRLPRS